MPRPFARCAIALTMTSLLGCDAGSGNEGIDPIEGTPEYENSRPGPPPGTGGQSGGGSDDEDMGGPGQTPEMGPGPDADPSVDAGPDPQEDMGPRGPVDLDELLEEERAALGVPALAALVFDADGAVALGAVGTRRAGEQAPVTDQDVWHLGSCTKAMTATLVARLVEDEVLEFETPLSEIFDDAQLNAAWADQTLADLLRHEAGAPASLAQSYPTLWESMWQRASDPPAQVRADVARELLLDQPPASQGGFTYSNASYLLVGAALEQRTGSSWEQLMRQEVFDPLDMSSCGFGSPASPGQTDQPWGHRYEGGSFEPVEPGLMADNPPALGPAGAVHCSLQDWAKFGRVHLGVGPAGYLGEETLQTLRDPSMSAQNYAMGWYAIQRGWAGSEPALNHAGSNTMNYALAWLAPAKDLGLLIVTNAASPTIAEDADGLAAELIPTYIAPE